jgi:RHS Repeat.
MVIALYGCSTTQIGDLAVYELQNDVKEVMVYQDGVSNYSYCFDKDGHLLAPYTSINSEGKWDNGKTRIFEYEESTTIRYYDKQGRLVKEYNDFEGARTEYQYDNHNRLSTSISGGEDSDVGNSTYYLYDDKGILEKKRVVTDYDGTSVYLYSGSENDSKGNWVKRLYNYSRDGENRTVIETREIIYWDGMQSSGNADEAIQARDSQVYLNETPTDEDMIEEDDTSYPDDDTSAEMTQNYIHNLNSKDVVYTDVQNDLLSGKVKSYTEINRPNQFSYGKILSDTPENYEYTLIKEFDSNGRITKRSITTNNRPIIATPSNLRSRYLIEGRILNCINSYPTFGRFSVLGSYYDLSSTQFGWFIECTPNVLSDITYQYNDKGQIMGMGSRFTYEYDTNGNLITRRFDNIPFFRSKWNGNRLVSVRNYDKNGNELQDDRANFDIDWISDQSYKIKGYTYSFVNNRIHSISSELSKNNLIKTNFTTFYYNENGHIVREFQEILEVSSNNNLNVVTTKDRTIKSKDYQYDSYGNLVKCTVHYEEKNLMNDFIKKSTTEYYEWKYEYDFYGNWIKKELFEIKRNDIEVTEQILTTTRQISYY